MGGRWSGRRKGFSRRVTTDHFCSVNTKCLKDNGLLKCTEGQLNWRVFDLSWSMGGEVTHSAAFTLEAKPDGKGVITMQHHAHDAPFQAHIERTTPHYGGTRYWFCCPGCSERTTTLYLFKDTPMQCRKCWRLCYRSQLQWTKWNLYERAEEIHRELGGDGDFATNMPPRPLRMHRRTYERKTDKIFDLWVTGATIRH